MKGSLLGSNEQAAMGSDLQHRRGRRDLVATSALHIQGPRELKIGNGSIHLSKFLHLSAWHVESVSCLKNLSSRIFGDSLNHRRSTSWEAFLKNICAFPGNTRHVGESLFKIRKPVSSGLRNCAWHCRNGYSALVARTYRGT